MTYSSSLFDDAPPPYERHPSPLPMYATSGTDATQFNKNPKLIASCKKRGISSVFGSQLHLVSDFVKIRVAIDVSKSMLANTIVRSPPGTETMSKVRSRLHPQTRWQELCGQLKLLFEICEEEELIPNGIDVFFIHDQTVAKRPLDTKGVRSWQEMEQVLPKKPNGRFTPTIDTLERMFAPSAMPEQDGPVLTLIFTDGLPNNGKGRNDSFLLQRRFAMKQAAYPQSHITIVLCTDDDDVGAEFNQLDRSIPRLDVMEDYASETAEIRRAQGAMFPFSRADYVVKLLLGSTIALWDKLDERMLSTAQLELFKVYGKNWDWNENWQDQCARRQGLSGGFQSHSRWQLPPEFAWSSQFRPSNRFRPRDSDWAI